MTDLDQRKQHILSLIGNGDVDTLYDQALSYLKDNPKDGITIVEVAKFFFEKSDFEKSLPFIEIVLKQEPQNLGNQLLYVQALDSAGHIQHAFKHLTFLSVLHKKNPSIQLLLGQMQLRNGKRKEALHHFKTAYSLSPDNTNILSELARASYFDLDTDLSIECYRKLIELNPNDANKHFSFALVLLSLGMFKEGWEHYHWRHKITRPYFAAFARKIPMWSGQSLHDKTLFLAWEQGLGDSIQYVRYAIALAEMGINILLDSPPLLKELFTDVAARYDNITMRAPENIDFHADYLVSLMDIPLITTFYNIQLPKTIFTYLKAPTDLVKSFSETLANSKGFRVGIVWQGNPHYPRDNVRSFPLSLFKEIAKMDNLDLISLQAFVGTDQIPLFDAPLINLEKELLNGPEGLSRLAAAIENMDLIVCCDSAIAHLAGALNKEVLLLIPSVPDWRWKLSGKTTEHYPSITLVRQPLDSNWQDVFNTLPGLILHKQLTLK